MKESTKKTLTTTNRIINSLRTINNSTLWLHNLKAMFKNYNIKMTFLKNNNVNLPAHIKTVSPKNKLKKCIFNSPNKSKDIKNNFINTDTLSNSIKKKSNSIDKNSKKSAKSPWRGKIESKNSNLKITQLKVVTTPILLQMKINKWKEDMSTFLNKMLDFGEKKKLNLYIN